MLSNIRQLRRNKHRGQDCLIENHDDFIGWLAANLLCIAVLGNVTITSSTSFFKHAIISSIQQDYEAEYISK